MGCGTDYILEDFKVNQETKEISFGACVNFFKINIITGKVEYKTNTALKEMNDLDDLKLKVYMFFVYLSLACSLLFPLILIFRIYLEKTKKGSDGLRKTVKILTIFTFIFGWLLFACFYLKHSNFRFNI